MTTHKELIAKVTKNFMAFSNLQTCADTQEFKNFNIISSQLAKLYISINSDSSAEKIRPIISRLEKSLPELISEIPKMMDEKNIQGATELYQAIKTDIGSLHQSLQQVTNDVVVEHRFSM